MACHRAALKVAHGVPSQTKSYTPSRGHFWNDSHNSSSRRSWSERCSPGRKALTMSMSSHSHPCAPRCAARPSFLSDRPENGVEPEKFRGFCVAVLFYVAFSTGVLCGAREVLETCLLLRGCGRDCGWTREVQETFLSFQGCVEL
jgi:hypothetical protein